jgi:elongation factor P--(R)-beta-lysine ligase
MEQWWRPDRFAARRENLAARGRILHAVRQFFADEGFIEVETPALQISPGLEPHLRAFGTTLNDPREASALPRYLHTSPEFAMKKLLAGGMTQIWQLCHVFRDGERGATHHPEFSMIEWYRAGATYRELMNDCEKLLRYAVLAAAPTPTLPRLRRRGMATASAPDALLPPRAGEGWDGGLSWHGKTANAAQPFERITVSEVFRRHADIDILATAPDPKRPDIALLAAQAQKLGSAPHPGDDWEDLYFRIFLERIEPKLGIGAPTILYDYPISMAALSRPKPGDSRLAERFELYACGLELANAFSELTDAKEQRARFTADQAKKKSLYGETYPIDKDFLAALEHGLPDCAGIALGFDRLVMLCTGAADIEEVLWAPVS